MANAKHAEPTELEKLTARVEFLERWVAIPAVHLPGYVAPVQEVEESSNAEGTGQSE